MPLDSLALIPLPPLLAAAFIAVGLLAGRIRGETDERLTSRVALAAVTLSLFMVCVVRIAQAFDKLETSVLLGTWLKSGRYQIDIAFTLDSLSLWLAGLFALLALMTLRFSVNYMHREAGFHRFFLVLSLFTGAMLLLVTAANAALCFVGWELAGVSSFLLIAYNYDRPTAAANATRAFVTNRIGDAGFIVGIALAFLWTGGIRWADIVGESAHLEEWQASLLACCFLLAAVAKSALVPLSPWLARAMEGPTPSSAIFYGAVMVHAGGYLILRLEPLFMQAPFAMAVLAALGLMTALYGFLCGLAQTDVKSALIFATTGQVGLMFLIAGLGFWDLAFWHLCAHALFRGLQFLSAPSLMHWITGLPPRPVHPWLGRQRGLYMAVLQRFWLEQAGDALLVKPVQKLAADLQAFDRQIIDPAFGLPAPPISIPESLAAAERRQRGEVASDPEILRVSGLPGRSVRALAKGLYWFEERLVLQGIGETLIQSGRRLGIRLNYIESLLGQPRYLVVFILASLMAVF